jgi:DNA polymerase III subunit epsilon
MQRFAARTRDAPGLCRNRPGGALPDLFWRIRRVRLRSLLKFRRESRFHPPLPSPAGRRPTLPQLNRVLGESVVYIDLETTGATAHFDRITEIGCVEVEQGRLVGEWSTLVNPEMRIPPAIEALTGISSAMVESAPTFSEIAPQLAERLRGKLLVAHNARFDYGFLRNEFKRVGIEFSSKVLCTVKLSRKLMPQHRRHNLDSVIERHGLACTGRHRALGDARVLWEFVQHLTREFDPEQIEACVKSQFGAPALPPGLDTVSLAGLPEAPGVYIFHGDNGAVLYVGKSVNLRSRVLSHFAADHRNAKDMRIAQQLQRVEWRETCGELGALLLEARLVKELAPAHNRRLRASDELFSIRWLPGRGGVEVAEVGDSAGEAWDELCGLFRTRRDAVNAMRELIEANELCPVVSGLEKGRGPCFASQIRKCRGACCGREPVRTHAARLAMALEALRLERWPFPKRIGIRERDSGGERSEVHVFDRWRYLGSATGAGELAELAADARRPAFDLDTQQILSRFLKKKRSAVEIVDLGAVALKA